MTSKKAFTGKEMAKLFEEAGWKLDRIKGSHYIYKKKNTSFLVSIPVHGGKTLKKGTQKNLFDILEEN